eukprot:22632_1
MSSLFDLKRVKHMNNHMKTLVFGYVRDCQNLLPCVELNIYYRIPQLVYHGCLLYYLLEEWDPKLKGERYELSQTNLLTKTEPGYQSAFLTQKVKSKGIYRWKFKVEYFASNYMGWDWIIGVWKTNKRIEETEAIRGYFTPNGNEDGYAWLGSCMRLTNPKMNGCYLTNENYGERLCTGDIVEMILDLTKLQIHWAKNGKHYPIAFENIEDCEYKAAVMIASKGNKIRLLDW